MRPLKAYPGVGRPCACHRTCAVPWDRCRRVSPPPHRTLVPGVVLPPRGPRGSTGTGSGGWGLASWRYPLRCLRPPCAACVRIYASHAPPAAPQGTPHLAPTPAHVRTPSPTPFAARGRDGEAVLHFAVGDVPRRQPGHAHQGRRGGGPGYEGGWRPSVPRAGAADLGIGIRGACVPPLHRA